MTSKQPSELRHVTIYTDGACIGNPGPGGYGVVLLYRDRRKELAGGYRKTTNNRMEIRAAIAGLEALKGRCDVTLFSDSEYLVKAIEERWVSRWRDNGWKRNRKEKALNTDLWSNLLSLCQLHQVQFRWVKGHAGDIENERCDHLAMSAATQANLPPDVVYEASMDSKGVPTESRPL